MGFVNVIMRKLELFPFSNVLSRIFNTTKTYSNENDVVSDVESLKYLYRIWDTSELSTSKKLFSVVPRNLWYADVTPQVENVAFYIQNEHISTTAIKFRSTPSVNAEHIIYFNTSISLTEYSKFGFWFAVTNPSGNEYSNIGIMNTGLKVAVFRAPSHAIDDTRSDFQYYTYTDSFIKQRNYLRGADILQSYPKQMTDRAVYIECDISGYSRQHYFAFIFKCPTGTRFENLEFLIMKPHVAR